MLNFLGELSRFSGCRERLGSCYPSLADKKKESAPPYRRKRPGQRLQKPQKEPENIIFLLSVGIG
jgi:hypothetical protein